MKRVHHGSASSISQDFLKTPVLPLPALTWKLSIVSADNDELRLVIREGRISGVPHNARRTLPTAYRHSVA